MNKNNLLVVLLLLLIVGAIYFFSRALEDVFFPESDIPVTYETDIPETQPEPAPPPSPPTPEEKAARSELRDGRILPGTAADKLLNFLLSGKRDFSRELYELKFHQFDAQQNPVDSLVLELQQIGQIMEAYQQIELEIAAHTDGTGSQSNQKSLSEKRAQQLKAFLVQEGVEESRIKAIGYGARYPIADSSTALGRQMNQRVEIVIQRL